tara:strand:- start:674 stop:1888 length:1215 start_codon:yes stop_codon:yes gene_type:complete
MIEFLRKLGPGLLFAGSAIGVSHLVQSTKAGANFGFGLLWALIIINIIKFPFFQFGPRYAAATGENLLEGYKKLGKVFLKIYMILSFATMFTIQTAVTVVTAAIASSLFGNGINVEIWTLIILFFCFLILLIGKFTLLDKLIKIIILILSTTTLIIVINAFMSLKYNINWVQVFPSNSYDIIFLIAFMGWMPAPLDVSIWQSIWVVEKQKITPDFEKKSILKDFNIGYVVTAILAIGFLSLGSLIMYGSNTTLSDNGSTFSIQLIEMYTSSIGDWSYFVIGIAALTTMLSTTLTTLDASPRAMNKSIELILDKSIESGYNYWITILILGTLIVFLFFTTEMGDLVKIATILSFTTAPIYALMNYFLICSKYTPVNYRPTIFIHFMSIFGIIFLIVFNIWYISIL